MELEKKLSEINVWSLAFGCIIGAGAFMMPGNTFLIKAGTLGTAIALGIAAIVMIIISFNYQYMINKFPISGGEFYYTKKTFGENHAIICSWFLCLSYLVIVSFNATGLAVIGRNLLPGVFQWGIHYSVAGYEIYFGEILLAQAALFIFAWLSVCGVKITGVFQTVLVVLLIGGIGVIVIAAVLNPNVTWSNLLPAFNPQVDKVDGILSVFVVTPWAFVGFDTVPQAAEEFKFPMKKAKRVMILSILFGAFIYMVLNTVTASVVPEGYVSWIEYIDDIENLDGISSLPTFYAAQNLLGTVGVFFVGVAVFAAILSGILGFYMATSRLLYSMAKEKMIPENFSRLHKQYKTPVIAIIFVLIVSLIAPFFGRTALGWIVDMSSIGAVIGYGYTSAVAWKWAKQEGNTMIVITGVLGVIMAISFGVLLLVPIPMFSCSLGKESYLCLLIWMFLGLCFYACQKRKRYDNGK